MTNKMLIDAIHPEETRVVVLRDKRVEDFDFESASRKPLRGNIYLAKVTRVEPSLQAAFVEYGGNKHGFLAFSEIHPDYYQIPQADRQALIAELEAEEAEPAPKESSRRSRSSRSRSKSAKSDAAASDRTESEAAADEDQDLGAADEATESVAPDALEADAATDPDGDDRAETHDGEAVHAVDAEDVEAAPAEAEAADASDESADAPVVEEEETAEADASAGESEPRSESDAGLEAVADDAAPETEVADATSADGEDETPPKPTRRRRSTKKSDDGLADPVVTEDDETHTVTSIGEADALEEVPERQRRAPRKNYKIQEVIKRRQILLVQVVKEERGTKGAALTTYLSLAGRYSVLMPNTNRGGGVSRKITDSSDRKRLKSLVAELEVPEGMGVILRTAGAARTKTEIKRDFEYLLRLWESVRDLTLQSIAPELVYEEGNLVKRAIRDLYSKEIGEVLVSGDAAYREAKDFMKMLMPSHAKNVKPYREATPIFTAYGVEGQLDAMFSQTVTLPSRGSIVINPTEALVAIDVNSGRSTKESNIEDTATKTNLEAADEVARQLRLRDLAGLIVIDFIDMDDKRHIRQVEKRLKDALKMDRSRIQVGRISPFGLLEMSRQRIRQGMVESSMTQCPACSGSGHVRSTQSVALYCLRALEEHLLKSANNHVTLRTSSAVALYILNQKRSHLNELETRFGLEIGVDADERVNGQHLEIVQGPAVERAPGEEPPVAQIADGAVEEEDEAAEAEAADTEVAEERSGSSSRRRRRRRRRGGGEDGADARERTAADAEDASADDEAVAADQESDSEEASAADGEREGDGSGNRRSRRRRGRRGGRRHRREDEGAIDGEDVHAEAAETDAPPAEDGEDAGEDAAEAGADGAPEMDGEDPIDQAAAAAEETPEAVEAAAPVEIEITVPAPAEESAEEVAEAIGATDAGDGGEKPAARNGAAATNGAAKEAEKDPDEDPAPTKKAKKPAPEQKGEGKPRRVGWWQRRSFF
ncbi:MAG: Rne/Rng family ribonuclease [Pseudomonadota bacterium]